jgi:hypothetical protein
MINPIQGIRIFVGGAYVRPTVNNCYRDLLQARLRQLDRAIGIGAAGDGAATGVIYVPTAQSGEVNVRTAIIAKLIIHYDPAGSTKSRWCRHSG